MKSQELFTITAQNPKTLIFSYSHQNLAQRETMAASVAIAIN